jgi:hypothetical protein
MDLARKPARVVEMLENVACQNPLEALVFIRERGGIKI